MVSRLFMGLYLGMVLITTMILPTISTAHAITLHNEQCLSSFEASGHNDIYTVNAIYTYDLCMNLPATNPNPPKIEMGF